MSLHSAGSSTARLLGRTITSTRAPRPKQNSASSSVTRTASTLLRSKYCSLHTTHQHLVNKKDMKDTLAYGGVNAVRDAYRATKKAATPAEPKPSKTSSHDVLDDILDSALPGRVRPQVPEFGNIESLKKHIQAIQKEEADLALEEDRARKEADALRSEEYEDDESRGFDAHAPVQVPREVFELNAQAQFAFLKEEYNDALEYLEQSLRMVRSRMGENHNEAATVMVSLAQVHEKLKNYSVAEKILSDALAIRKVVDGPAHTSVAVALNKLAHIQTLQKKYDEAIRSNKQAFRIVENAQRQNDHELAYYVSHQMEIPDEIKEVQRALITEAGQILNTRGAIHFKNKDQEEAIKDWNSAIDVWTKILPDNDSIANPISAAHRNLVHLYKQRNDGVGAIDTARRLVALLERHQPRSALFPNAISYLSKVYEHFSLYTDAYHEAKRAHQTSVEINGPGEDTDELALSEYLLSKRIMHKLNGPDQEEE